jgi:hypothetical protein
MNRCISVVFAIVLACSLVACGSGSGSARSVKAYCDTVAKYRDRYLTAMDAANSAGGLGGLLGGVSAIGDIKNMWVDMAKVAPDDIQTDTEAVRDAWKQAEDASVKGDYFGAITTALMNSAASQRVNDYIITNCGAEYAPG